MTDTNEIKKFLEWTESKEIFWAYGEKMYLGGKQGQYTQDELIAEYEKETKKYTVGEVWDSTLSECVLEWSKWSVNIKEKFIAFAERYAELKAEGRIKE